MCGVSGAFAYRSDAPLLDRQALVAVRDRMRTRGPDGAGLWLSADGRLGLGHRRLSIIELSEAGAQPMLDPSGRYAIVFNGEIYNYPELMAELQAAGAQFRGHSDTEVILQLFAREGPAMLTRLRGMFALAIWDGERRELLLARDPYGIKPLYFSEHRGCLRFASQAKALLADPAVPRDMDAAGLVGFHLFGAVPEPFTLYRSIRALPAGSYCIARAGSGLGASVAFASIAGRIAEATPRAFDAEEAQAAVRDSVAKHLVADVEVGAFLSAGVDSGALVGLMHDLSPQPPRTVTLRFAEFAGSANDETPLAAAVAQQYGASHHVRGVTRAEFLEDLPRILDAMDQPTIDGFNSWFVSKATRELGLKVALSGLGGDELFAGYSTFATVPATHRRFGAVSRLGLGPAARRAMTMLAPKLIERNPKAAGMFDWPATWEGAYLLRRALLLPHELAGLMEPAVVREGLAELDVLGLIGRATSPAPESDNGRVAALEATMYMRNQLLRDSDWAGMAHSLEIRVPLVDYWLLGRIAPMMASLAPGMGKRTLAGAPSMPLPDAVVNRPKTGFQIPVMGWLRGSEAHVPDRRDSRGWAAHVLRAFTEADPVRQAA